MITQFVTLVTKPMEYASSHKRSTSISSSIKEPFKQSSNFNQAFPFFSISESTNSEIDQSILNQSPHVVTLQIRVSSEGVDFSMGEKWMEWELPAGRDVKTFWNVASAPYSSSIVSTYFQHPSCKLVLCWVIVTCALLHLFSVHHFSIS